jgi:hypothetical protein
MSALFDLKFDWLILSDTAISDKLALLSGGEASSRYRMQLFPLWR